MPRSDGFESRALPPKAQEFPFALDGSPFLRRLDHDMRSEPLGWLGRPHLCSAPHRRPCMPHLECMNGPNENTSADGGWRVLCVSLAQWPATAEFLRWARLR